VCCDSVSEEIVKTAHDGGELVFAWDSGSEGDLKGALRCGIDIIMTDRPDIAIRVISGL
jgi:glycerophosphoryl diester phosphodiesterase